MTGIGDCWIIGFLRVKGDGTQMMGPLLSATCC